METHPYTKHEVTLSVRTALALANVLVLSVQLRFETAAGSRVLRMEDTPEMTGLRDGDTIIVRVPH